MYKNTLNSIRTLFFSLFTPDDMTRHRKDRARRLTGGILHPVDYVRRARSERRMKEGQGQPFFPQNSKPDVPPHISPTPQAHRSGDPYENRRLPFSNALPVYSSPSTPHVHLPPMNSTQQYASTVAPQPVQYAHPDIYSRYPSYSVMTNEVPPPVPPKDFIPERVNRTPLIFQYQSPPDALRY
ncbi:hypothetical protein BDZ89DRAFT_1216843 [Hymenopellis radicata]|nr:hypothetical protein BDZ89DRAFT_1216843 [Hymenopellis radicata]